MLSDDMSVEISGYRTVDRGGAAEGDAAFVSDALTDEGRRAREVASQSARFCALVDIVDASVGPLSPVEQVRLGLYIAHRGVVQGRVQLERIEREARELRADLVDGEERLRTMASDAVRARRPRHAMALEGGRPPKPLADARPALTVTSPVDERTQGQLARMGLGPHAPAAPPKRESKPRGWFSRLFTREAPPYPPGTLRRV